MHFSIADVEEKDLVRRVLSDEQWRQRLIGHFSLADTLVYPEVPLEGLVKLQGDVGQID